MRTFRREATEPCYVAEVDAAERAVLLDVVGEVLDLLSGDGPEPAEADASTDQHPLDAVRMDSATVVPPWDPALRRLLPDASRDDPEVSAEFRRLTEADLRAGKADNLRTLAACLQGAQPHLVVVPSDAPQVAAAFTDLRLVVSERLGVRTDADADALYALVTTGPEEPATDEAEVARRFLATVYVVLSVLQESLVELMLHALGEQGDPRHDSASGPPHG